MSMHMSKVSCIMSIKAQEKGSRQACSKSYPQGGWDRGSNCQCCGQGSNAPQTHLPAADVEQGVKPTLIQLPGTPDPDDLAGQHGLADASLLWNTTVLTGFGCCSSGSNSESTFRSSRVHWAQEPSPAHGEQFVLPLSPARGLLEQTQPGGVLVEAATPTQVGILVLETLKASVHLSPILPEVASAQLSEPYEYL